MGLPVTGLLKGVSCRTPCPWWQHPDEGSRVQLEAGNSSRVIGRFQAGVDIQGQSSRQGFGSRSGYEVKASSGAGMVVVATADPHCSLHPFWNPPGVCVGRGANQEPEGCCLSDPLRRDFPWSVSVTGHGPWSTTWLQLPLGGSMEEPGDLPGLKLGH